MDLHAVRRAYKRYAPVYDLLFGPVMQIGRLRTVAAVNAMEHRRVLEIGVGTGLSLPHYRPDKRIVGIDVSAEMLKVAHNRIAEQKLTNAGILQMDAEKLAFADGEFDVVVAMYVLSVVPDPARVMAEMQRVCKPGGAILICNHTIPQEKTGASASNIIAPFARWLGWRPDFTLDPLLKSSGLDVRSKRSVPPFNLFTVLECRNPPPNPVPHAAE